MKTWLIAFALTLSVLSLAAKEDQPCNFHDLSNPEYYDVQDAQSPRFFASAEVMPHETQLHPPFPPGHRTLFLNLQLKDKDGRSVLRGKEQFARVLKHFEGKFDQIIADFERPPTEGELSDNLTMVNDATAKGSTIEEAFRLSWVGQRCREAGYTEVRVLKTEGTPGHYTSAYAVFSKPN